MEFKDVDNRDLVVNELVQGRELTKQLLKLLEPSTPLEKPEFLMDRILATYDKALNLVNFDGHPIPPDPSRLSFHRRQSSGHGEDRLRPSKKRRNTLPRRVEKVKLSSGEELPSDGYSWRKYGQKIILGAKFRRGYFRCTHRRSQGCSALKQVQKSDEDPTIFHVIYVDDHTCTPPCHLIPPSTSTNPPRVHLNLTQHSQEEDQQQLTVQTEELGNGNQENSYFRSTSFSTLFAPAMVASGSNPLPSSPANINGVWTPESDLREGFSAPNSGENSPIEGLEFTLEDLGIDPNFPFDDPEMFA